jgi:hypothetical protein
MRKQLVNPRKVYAVDTGMITVNSGSFTEDDGRKLENLVYLHLRRAHRELYYFSEKGECDFVVFNNRVAVDALQVCFELNPDNLDREIKGLMEALTALNLKKGRIITVHQKDRYEKEGRVIDVVPCHEFLLS